MTKYLLLFLLTMITFAPSYANPVLNESSSDAISTPGAGLAEYLDTQACPKPSDDYATTNVVAGNDCCKDHKGVCGCRAGKIVCCDGTASENCTCHKDSSPGIIN